jgi:hypothetical protein
MGIQLPLKVGSKGLGVREAQEWLCLHGILIQVDGDRPGGGFGLATEAAVKAFQKAMGCEQTGIVDKKTWDFLGAPLSLAASETRPLATLPQTIVAVARRHLEKHPREVGGENCGPWVRYYMDAVLEGRRAGPNYPWCAGFVCSIVRQAALAHGVEMPIPDTVSCDDLARGAERLVGVASKEEGRPSIATDGSVFLLRHRTRKNDWVHTGIVTRFHGSHYATIEGNTNDEGSREGYEVCERIRAYGRSDFSVIT